ncbi:hypothetical protein ACH4UT_27960 [Streptomyces sp. NPDC020799]|uniref:hypothetical protein n=1 Tax=Streptomyces sp. NPDC020799 TaxID=3365091 RepID=UPI0037A336D8
MSPDLIAAAVLIGPAAILAPVCLTGHLRQARHDAAAAAVLAAYHPAPPAPPDPPRGGGEPLPALPGERLATVTHLDTRRCRTTSGERKTA